jgi:protein-tyrosine phosphatase
MTRMIDLHAHVLAGVDDGPATLEESVELARRAVADGVATLAATPHLRDDHPGVVPEELAARREELDRRLAEEEVALELVAGGEVDVSWALDATDDVLDLVSYGQRGSDLLVETPYGELPHHFERMLDAIRWRGYRVLLAHPERNPTFQRSPERLARLVEGGVLVQVTAASLVGSRKSRSRRLARAAVSEGMAHVIASDAHGFATVDRPSLSQGVAAASEFDRGRAYWMVTDAPAAVLEAAPLSRPPSGSAPRRGMFARAREVLGVQGWRPSNRRR